MKQELERLKDEKKAIVLIDRYFPDLDTSYVTVDNFKGAYEATMYLVRKGYKRIGMVTTNSAQVQMQQRYEGYEKALIDQGQGADGHKVLKLDFDQGKDRSVARIANFIAEQNPDALFFTTNYLGVYGLESLRVSGKRVPGDMGMICFDDNDLFRLGTPSVTVVAQPIELIGREAVTSLLHQLKNKELGLPPSKSILEPRLIVRET